MENETNKATENNNQQNQNDANMNNQQNEQNANADEVSKKAIADMLKKLGVDSEESLSTIVQNYNKSIEDGKTDLQKAQGLVDTTTKQLAEERKARLVAEAKLEALKLGANAETVDDLVIVATAKATKEKPVSEIIKEMKENNSIYFKDEEGQRQGKRKPVVTRANATKEQNKTKQNDSGSSNSIAERLYSKKSQSQSGKRKTYFTN